jgi:hypothetical protein
MVADRKAHGLYFAPGREEVEARALERVTAILSDGYFVGADGVLMTFEWDLAAVTKGG